MPEKIKKYEDENDIISTVINYGADITGGLTAAAIPLLFSGPAGWVTLAAAASAPVVVGLLRKLGKEIHFKSLAPREQVKMGATFAIAAHDINKRFENGETPRSDDFFDPRDDDRSFAETVSEGIFIKARDEHEEKKLKHYSYLLSSLTFSSAISFNQANTLLKLSESLSYRQFCMIAYINIIGQLKLKNLAGVFLNDEEIQQYRDFYYEYLDLHSKQIIKEWQGISIGKDEGELSLLGHNLYDLMKLNEVDQQEIDNVQNIFELILNSSAKL